MTASNNSENITVQLLSNFGAIVLSTSSRTAENPNDFYQNVDFFIKFQIICQCIMSEKS